MVTIQNYTCGGKNFGALMGSCQALKHSGQLGLGLLKFKNRVSASVFSGDSQGRPPSPEAGCLLPHGTRQPLQALCRPAGGRGSGPGRVLGSASLGGSTGPRLLNQLLRHPGLGHGYQGTLGPCCWGSTGHPELPLTTSRQPNTFQQPLAPHPGSAERSRAWPGRAFLSPVEFPQPHRDQQQEEALPEEVPSTRQVACGHCSHG